MRPSPPGRPYVYGLSRGPSLLRLQTSQAAHSQQLPSRSPSSVSASAGPRGCRSSRRVLSVDGLEAAVDLSRPPRRRPAAFRAPNAPGESPPRRQIPLPDQAPKYQAGAVPFMNQDSLRYRTLPEPAGQRLRMPVEVQNLRQGAIANTIRSICNSAPRRSRRAP